MSHLVTKKILWLQVLRALAALMVVVDHSIYTINERGAHIASYLSLGAMFGLTGVAIFFAISGFVMTHITERDFQRPNASLDFMKRRLIRIVPLYWLATTIYVVKLAATGQMPSILDMARSYSFVPYLDVSGAIRPIYGLGWTIDYEMYFYLVLAVALLSPRKIGLLMTATALTAPIVLGLFFEHDPAGVLGVFFLQPLILMFIAGIGFRSLIYKPRVTGQRSKPYFLFLETVSVALGDASYSIYLTHSFVIGPIATLWSRTMPEVIWPIFVFTSVVVSACIGWIIHRYCEVPMLSKFNHLFLHQSELTRLPASQSAP